jgi:hypothetical protein
MQTQQLPSPKQTVAPPLAPQDWRKWRLPARLARRVRLHEAAG